MGGICSCSDASRTDFTHESLLETESKTKKTEKRTEAFTDDSSKYIPIKQNKKNEQMQSNEGKADAEYDENSLLAIAHCSNHFIRDLVDADAQKEGDEDSISDLSDGFDENGQTKDLIAAKTDNSHKAILRFKSKANWDTMSLQNHEDEMLAEMRRLSVSQTVS